MSIHVTDLPLELLEIATILGLAVGLLLQNRALKHSKDLSERHLAQANDELKHLRRMLDRILMVEKGYARPSEKLEDNGEAPDHKHRPTRLL